MPCRAHRKTACGRLCVEGNFATCPDLLACGQAVAALVEADAPRETALAIIPMGTANDFARGLGIPVRLLPVLAHAHAPAHRVCQTHDRPCMMPKLLCTCLACQHTGYAQLVPTVHGVPFQVVYSFHYRELHCCILAAAPPRICSVPMLHRCNSMINSSIASDPSGISKQASPI